MSWNSTLGKIGEDFACSYLASKGYLILERNWRFNHKEIDIIALDGNWIVFVEVKTRSSDMNPNDVISPKKRRLLLMAANRYISYHKIMREARCDVILLTRKGKTFDVLHIPEAFR